MKPRDFSNPNTPKKDITANKPGAPITDKNNLGKDKGHHTTTNTIKGKVVPTDKNARIQQPPLGGKLPKDRT